MPHDATAASPAIPVRKPQLDFERAIERFYLEGNPVKTHFFNALNLLFPEGERFFVKSVYDHLGDIDDPQLKRDIRGFAGQEGQHANQHERFFAVLEQQDYDLGPVLRPFKKLAKVAKHLPRGVRLSITAGAEHYTATMASLLLEHDVLGECDPTLRKLITWHAIEEIEHKHVAYDVFVKVYPRGYFLRQLGFVIATAVIAGFTFAGLRSLLLQDGRKRRLTRKQFEDGRAAMRTGKQLAFRRAMGRQLVRYFVPGFHPNQHDDQPLLARVLPSLDLAFDAR